MYLKVQKHFIYSTLLASFVFIFAANALAQSDASGENNEQIDYAAIQSGMEQLTTSLEATRADIMRSRFDPTALVDRLGPEADAAIEYVQNSIVYQPYSGALRGAAGTLRAGAGNSLDQAILLANLLKTGGLDAQIARSILTDDDAMRLLFSTGQVRNESSLDYLQDSLAKNFGLEANEPSATVIWTETELATEAGKQIDALKLALLNSDVDLADNDAHARWLPVVKEYFWVQYRTGPSQQWQDVHPVFGSGYTPTDLEKSETFKDSVPAKYHHMLTVSAWIGQWVAGKIKNRQVMKAWANAVANLDVQTITYRNLPSGLTRDNAGDLAAAVKQTKFLTPMLNDAKAPGAVAFDLQGNTVDPMAMGGSAGIFQTMGNKMGKATTGLMDRKDKQPAMALNSMWLEFTFTAPGGKQTTHRRYLVAPRADHNSDESALLWSLLTNHTYLVNAGGQSLDYLADRYLATGISNQAWLAAMIGKFRDPDGGMTKPDEDIPADFPVLSQYHFMDDNPFSPNDVIDFRATPSLIGIRRGYRDASTAFAGVDIVSNRLEHLRISPDSLQQVPSAGLARGVWDTMLESVPGKLYSARDASVTSTASVFKLAAEQSIELKVLEPGSDADLASFGLDANTGTAVKTDLEHGFTVVLPERIPEGASMAGWWRINTNNGETLGMTGDGYGQDLVEYATDVVGIAFNMTQALQSLKDCDQQANDIAKMCCLVEANINNVAGLGFGTFLGATVGSAGGALFDILNYATTSATSGTGLMPAAKLGCDKMAATEW